jgi:hypothetical protein
MAKIPVLDAVRIIPRDTDFLDRKSGARGEIFFDRTANSLRLYDGINAGGINLAKSDLSNVSNAEFLAKATAAGVEGGSSGNVTVSVSPTIPGSPTNGNLWLNTETGILYVYINDGNSNQWIQPAVPSVYVDLTGLATETFVTTAIDNIPEVDLTGLATETFVTTAIDNIPEVDLTGLATETFVNNTISSLLETSAETIQTLNELTAALEDDEFATAITNEIGLKAPINDPTFTGTVSGVTATMVGLGNVTNESKATMFASPTFTGTVSGVTATMVGLGNVTNESKSTMFSSPTFTGTVTQPGSVIRAVTASVSGFGLDPIDTFDSTVYRAAIYHIQSSDPTYGYQYSKLTMIHDGTTVTMTESDVVFTRNTSSYMVYDCTITENTATLSGAAFQGTQTTVIKGWVQLIGV